MEASDRTISKYLKQKGFNTEYHNIWAVRDKLQSYYLEDYASISDAILECIDELDNEKRLFKGVSIT